MKLPIQPEQTTLQELALRFEQTVRGLRLHTIPRLSLDDVAGLLGASRYDISRAVNLCCGCSFSEYMNLRRMEEVRQLLRSAPPGKKLTVNELARQAGFSDRKGLHRVCKRLTGLSPEQLRKSILSEP